MNPADFLLDRPTDLGVWLMLGYAFVILMTAKVTELLARAHFERARRHTKEGFRYDADFDHYACPQGQRLTLQSVEPTSRVAVYQARAEGCSICPLKPDCAPHGEGRRVFRPLREWVETEVGRFHQWLSLLIIGSGAVVSLAAFALWAGRPGSGLLVIACAALLLVAIRDVRWIWTSSIGTPYGPAQK
jgi:hypothetical protein